MMSKDEKKCSKENCECEENKECKNHSNESHEHHKGKCKELEAKIADAIKGNAGEVTE